MARSAAEVSTWKGLGQLRRRRGPDHLSSQASNVHVVICHALMRGEDIVDQTGTYAGNLVRGAERSADIALYRRRRLFVGIRFRNREFGDRRTVAPLAGTAVLVTGSSSILRA
jgi:hypothetical protein